MLIISILFHKLFYVTPPPVYIWTKVLQVGPESLLEQTIEHTSASIIRLLYPRGKTKVSLWR